MGGRRKRAVWAMGQAELFAPQRVTVEDAAQRFVVSRRAAHRYSDRYLESLEFVLKSVERFARERRWPDVSAITTAHMEEYLAFLGERGLSRASIDFHYVRLRVFFDWLVERSLLHSNPFDLIPRPKVEERVIPVVSKEEFARVSRLMDPSKARTTEERFRLTRNRAVLYLLWDTPARRSEVESLKVADVDVEIGRARVMGKGQRERWIPLGLKTVEVLEEYLAERAKVDRGCPELWVDARGNALRPGWLYLMLRRYGLRAGVPGLHPHRFRHTYAVHALRERMSERTLKTIGGWKKIPDTYFRTLAFEDALREHRRISPADQV